MAKPTPTISCRITDIPLTSHLYSTLLELLNILSLLFICSMEALFITHKQEPIFHFLSLSLFLLYLLLKTYFSTPSPVYLVDFSCLKPPIYCRVPFSSFLEHSKIIHSLDQESLSFLSKVLTSSGQSQQTYTPPALHYIPPRSTHEAAIQEAQMVLFPVFEDLLSKTNVSPNDIDILIVNCSGFCPSPSLSSIIVNKYSMREDVKSFNISGMGCSASALAIDMAQNLLKTHKNSNAVILSTEILSNGWYSGKERSMMVLNCLFRMGSAAVLVTNKKEAQKTSKYKLLWALRTQRAFQDEAYLSAFREEDSNGLTGVTLRRDLVQVAGESLRSNIVILGMSILPITEKLRYGLSIMWKRLVDKSAEIYVPDFKKVVQHFCLPTSGKPLIREMGKGLKLGEGEMEAALMTLHRYGNQSSSSLWYELAYMEAKERVKEGEKVWQVGIGSGIKCTSLIWECVRPIVGEGKKGPWADSIDKYPIYQE